MTVDQIVSEDEVCSECGEADVPLDDDLCEHCWNKFAYEEEQKRQQELLRYSLKEREE